MRYQRRSFFFWLFPIISVTSGHSTTVIFLLLYIKYFGRIQFLVISNYHILSYIYYSRSCCGCTGRNYTTFILLFIFLVTLSPTCFCISVLVSVSSVLGVYQSLILFWFFHWLFWVFFFVFILFFKFSFPFGQFFYIFFCLQEFQPFIGSNDWW